MTSTEYDTLLLFAPPGSAKSYHVSAALPPWYLANYPQNSIIGASHNVELAEKWGRRCRNLVNEHGKTLGIELDPQSTAAGRWSLAQGGEYMAAGAGVGIAGFRADLGVIDDPFGKREDAYSATIRQKVWDWYIDDFSARLKPNARRVIMHTRWHTDDLAGRVIELSQRNGKPVRVVSIPAIAGENDMLGRKVGEWLWDDPQGYDYGAFLRARHAETPPHEWSAMYQQEPTQEGGEFFKREWLRWYDEAPKGLRIYGASDYAVTANGGDLTVHGIAGLDADDNLYILDWWRSQSATDVWIEALLDMAAKWKPLMWAEEQGQIIKSVGPFITARQRERRVYFAREQFVSATDKPTRAQSIRGRMSMGKVYLPSRAPWLSDVLANLMTFPVGKNDDDVDVFSLFGRMLDKMRGARPVAGGLRPVTHRDYGGHTEPTADWKVA